MCWATLNTDAACCSNRSRNSFAFRENLYNFLEIFIAFLPLQLLCVSIRFKP
ncbi:uncharacterized protein DS421_1g31810 [Arachis hypogaea]|nr:uncharacterized protein DS421_1g31810 [Arachis hypogaea]